MLTSQLHREKECTVTTATSICLQERVQQHPVPQVFIYGSPSSMPQTAIAVDFHRFLKMIIISTVHPSPLTSASSRL